MRLSYLSNVFIKSGLISLLSCILPVIVLHSMEEGLVRLIAVSAVSVLSTSITIFFLGISSDTRSKVVSFVKRKF